MQCCNVGGIKMSTDVFLPHCVWFGLCYQENVLLSVLFVWKEATQTVWGHFALWGERIPPWNIHLSLTAKLSERTLSALQEQWKEIHNGWQENVGKSHIKTTQEEKPNQSFLPDGRKSETWKRQITKWTDSWGETQGIYVSLKVEREKSLFRAQEAQKMEEDEELRERRERKADYLCRLSHFWGRVSLQRLIQQNVSENTTASPPPFNLLRPRRTQRASHELQAEHLRTFKNV